MIDKNVIGEDNEIIKESMKDGFGLFAKHEAILKRSEEVKRDSIKIKLLENILSKLSEIYILLKNKNDKDNCQDDDNKCDYKEQNELHIY